jgi:hypothetical protein
VLPHHNPKIWRQIAFPHDRILPLVKRQYIACFAIALCFEEA